MDEEIKLKKESVPQDTKEEPPLEAVPSTVSAFLVPRSLPLVGGDTKLSADFVASGLVYQTATPVTVSTDAQGGTETYLMRYVFQANSLHVGNVIRITACGYYTSDGSTQFSLRVASGIPGTYFEILKIEHPIANVTAQPWEMQTVLIVKNIGTGALFGGFLRSTINATIKNDATLVYDSFNSQIKLTLNVTAQWSSTVAMGNSITLTTGLIEVLN